MKKDSKTDFIPLLQPQSQSPTVQRDLIVTFLGHNSRGFSLVSTKGIVPNGCFYNCGFQSINRWLGQCSINNFINNNRNNNQQCFVPSENEYFPKSSVLLYCITWVWQYQYYVLCCDIKYILTMEITVKKKLHRKQCGIKESTYYYCLPSLETSWRYCVVIPIVTDLPSSSKPL